ncbi:CxxC-x17-CxxC domain-containing protein [Patescibacteria group bacterium]
MSNFKFGNRSRGSNDSFRRNSGGRDGGRDGGRPTMHDAVCHDCGKNCQVPFRPNNDKPIFCSECFETKGGRDNNRSNRRDSGRRDFGNRDSGRSSDRRLGYIEDKIDTLNVKLDRVIDLLSSEETQPEEEVEKKVEKKKVKKETKNVIDEVLTLVEDKSSDKVADPIEEIVSPKKNKKIKKEKAVLSEKDSKKE